jgi:GntR family transcriptional repressor for pyruvate dehydrogenase complex
VADEELFQPIQPTRVSDSAVDQILNLIAEGHLKPGDRLPSERELVRQLEVSRASVREALRALEARDVIEVKPGSGSFVRGSGQDEAGPNWVPWLLAHRHEIMQLVELREALETRAAYLAATRASQKQIEAMKNAIDRMSEAIENGDPDLTVQADKAFHESVAKACGNELMAYLLNSANEALADPRSAILSLPGRATKSLAEHRLIWQAIANRNPKQAETAVLHHIEGVVEDLPKVEEVQDHPIGPKVHG